MRVVEPTPLHLELPINAPMREVVHVEDQFLGLATSTLAMAEVLMIKGKNPIPPENAEAVREFFQRTYIKIRPLDRRIAQLSQDLVWKHGIRPKDAVHVATALVTDGVDELHTFDGGLLAKSGLQVDGHEPLTITRPVIENFQGSIL